MSLHQEFQRRARTEEAGGGLCIQEAPPSTVCNALGHGTPCPHASDCADALPLFMLAATCSQEGEGPLPGLSAATVPQEDCRFVASRFSVVASQRISASPRPCLRSGMHDPSASCHNPSRPLLSVLCKLSAVTDNDLHECESSIVTVTSVSHKHRRACVRSFGWSARMPSRLGESQPPSCRALDWFNQNSIKWNTAAVLVTAQATTREDSETSCCCHQTAHK